MPVDYKGGEHSKPVIRSFIASLVRLFYMVSVFLNALTFFLARITRINTAFCVCLHQLIREIREIRA